MRPALIAALALATTAAAPAGFSHKDAADVWGYYVPAKAPGAGSWRLQWLVLGQADEFAAWEHGKRSRTSAPIMLEFEDVATPMVEDPETGGEHHKGQMRILPDAYAVTGRSFHFVGHDRRLGQVVFDGVLDPKALERARNNESGGDIVLTGTLTLAAHAHPGLRFTWFGGD